MLTLGQNRNNLVFLTGEERHFKYFPICQPVNIYSLTEEFNGHLHVESNGNQRSFSDLALRVTRLIPRTVKA